MNFLMDNKLILNYKEPQTHFGSFDNIDICNWPSTRTLIILVGLLTIQKREQKQEYTIYCGHPNVLDPPPSLLLTTAAQLLD